MNSVQQNQQQINSPTSGEGISRGFSESSNQQPLSQEQRPHFDWVDVFKEQRNRKEQQQNLDKVNEQNRKEKYRMILEQEMSEKEARRIQEYNSKKLELQDIRSNVKMNNDADLFRQRQVREHEKTLMQQNIQVGEQKKLQDAIKKREEAEKANQLYTLKRLEQNQALHQSQEIKKEKEQQFNQLLDSQMKENKSIKELKDLQQKAFEDQLQKQFKGIGSTQERKKPENTDRNLIYAQIEQANKEKEKRQLEFENSIVYEGQKAQIMKERRQEERKMQEKSRMQNATDYMVGMQLELKKTRNISNQQAQLEERDQANATYLKYLEAEKNRIQNQRQLYQRQDYVNQQQAKLKGQLKDRQKHMNENEIKLNSDKLLLNERKSPFQTTSNQIYMDDYVSFDRQKQLNLLDHTFKPFGPASFNQSKANALLSNFGQGQKPTIAYSPGLIGQKPSPINSMPLLTQTQLPQSPKQVHSHASFSPRNEIKQVTPLPNLSTSSVQLGSQHLQKKEIDTSPRMPTWNSSDANLPNKNNNNSLNNDRAKRSSLFENKMEVFPKSQAFASMQQQPNQFGERKQSPGSPENYYNQLNQNLKTENNGMNRNRSTIIESNRHSDMEKQFNIKAVNLSPMSHDLGRAHDFESKREGQNQPSIPIYRNPPRDILSNSIAAGIQSDKVAFDLAGSVGSGTMSRQKTGSQPNLNYLQNRTNIISAQRQDYAHIRQQNANWAQRGFNIITGAQ